MHAKITLYPIVRKSIDTCTREIIVQFKISKLADDTELFDRAGNINAVNERQEDAG